jgi:multiple sugar transport system substrate-binding protein
MVSGLITLSPTLPARTPTDRLQTTHSEAVSSPCSIVTPGLWQRDIAPLPYNQKGERISRIDADNFTITNSADNQQAAWEVMKWLTDPEQIVDVCLIYGCIPARESVAAEFRTELEKRWPGLDYDVIFKSIDYLDNPNHESYVPEWGRVEDALNNSLSLIYSGENKNAQEVLDQVNAEVQQILDGYWANH